MLQELNNSHAIQLRMTKNQMRKKFLILTDCLNSKFLIAIQIVTTKHRTIDLQRPDLMTSCQNKVHKIQTIQIKKTYQKKLRKILRNKKSKYRRNQRINLLQEI